MIQRHPLNESYFIMNSCTERVQKVSLTCQLIQTYFSPALRRRVQEFSCVSVHPGGAGLVAGGGRYSRPGRWLCGLSLIQAVSGSQPPRTGAYSSAPVLRCGSQCQQEPHVEDRAGHTNWWKNPRKGNIDILPRLVNSFLRKLSEVLL